MLTFYEQFSIIAKKQPNHIALFINNTKITYAELSDTINKIANNLRDIKDKIIPIYSASNYYIIASLLAIWKMGKAATVIHYTAWKNISLRKKEILNQLNTSFIIDDKKINKWLSLPINKNIVNKITIVNLNDLANIIWTSGSTGRSKGVKLTHKNILIGQKVINELIKGCKKLINITSLGFIGGQMFILTSILQGAPAVVTDFHQKFDKNSIDLINEKMGNKEKYVSVFPPHILFTKLHTHEFEPKQILKLISGSDIVSNIYDKNIEILSAYGASETCGPITVSKITRKQKNTPLGRPINPVKIYILDKNLKCTKKCQIGEIYVSGNIAEGYMNDPTSTKQHFIDFVYNGKNIKLFKTNDLGYWNKNNELVFVQRNDFVIKIDGHQINPCKIEHDLKEIKGIHDAVVGSFSYFDITKNPMDFGLYGIYAGIINNNKIVKIEHINKILSKKLPKYMLPHIYAKIKRVPLTSIGKLDRKHIIPENFLINLVHKINENIYLSEDAKNKLA